MGFATLSIPRSVRQTIDTIENAGYEAWLVGGCVRDIFLERVPHDWDVCTDAHPETIVSLFAKTIPTGLQHGTVTVIVKGHQFEVTTWRAETTYSDHRRPDSVLFTKNLAEDLSRRDFTVNAMAWHPTRGLSDPVCGLEDLQHKLIRCVGDPHQRFSEDALRMMRALRFCSELDFTLHTDTANAIAHQSTYLRHVSKERILNEFRRTLKGKEPKWLHLIWTSGLASHIFQLPAPDERVYVVLKNLHQTHAPEALYWSALLYFCKSPVEALQDMRLENTLLHAIRENIHYLPLALTGSMRNIRFCAAFSGKHAQGILQLASVLVRNNCIPVTMQNLVQIKANLNTPQFPFQSASGQRLADLGFVGKDIAQMQMILALIWCERPLLFDASPTPEWLIQILRKKANELLSK